MKSIKTIHRKLIQKLDSVKDATILDYGCGKGGIIKLLTQDESQIPHFIYAVDSDHEAIKNIEEMYSDKIKKGQIRTQIVANPSQLRHDKFDKIMCHNVLECIETKEFFVQDLYTHLAHNGILVLSHHDFDSAAYNSSFVQLTRNLIHFFSDKGESWQNLCDGQIGRKIPGIFKRAGVDYFEFETWRIVETTFEKDDYSYLMAQMILAAAKDSFDQTTLNSWIRDLEEKAQNNDFYFAIDVVIVKAINADSKK